MENKSFLPYIVFAVVLIAGGLYFYSNFKPSPQGTPNEYVAGNNTNTPATTTATGTPVTVVDEISQPAPVNKAADTAAKPSATNTINKTSNMITIQTNFGNIVFQTYNEDAPKTVANFITLANQGFYNNLTFHRVIDKFMIQGGDPTGNGTGGPGYTFEDELDPNTKSYKNGYQKGVVAMANAGPNTNGSQFFIMLADTPLPHAYTIFGKVVSGQDVVDKIGKTKTDANDKPISPVTMQKVVVEQ